MGIYQVHSLVRKVKIREGKWYPHWSKRKTCRWHLGLSELKITTTPTPTDPPPHFHPDSFVFRSSFTALHFMVHPAHSPQKKRSDIKKMLCNSQQPQKTAPSINSPSEFTQYNPMNCPKNVSLTGLFNNWLVVLI